VRKVWLLGGLLISLVIVLLLVQRFSASSTSDAVPPQQTIRYESRNLPNAIVHILWVPASSEFSVTPALSEKVATVEEFAKTKKAMRKPRHFVNAILNAGFFDPENQKSTSYVIQAGKLVADPNDNERLVNNPKLKPYLSKITNRTEFRRYKCQQGIRYDIALHNEQSAEGCQLLDALGGGPRLLPELTSVQEGFVDYANGRDSIGSKQPNARTAVGITKNGSIVLVMVGQKPSAINNSGMSIQALADFMKTLDVVSAMNLDGGSSSSFYFDGKSFYGKLDEKGNPVKRQVKSVLIVDQI
jgi:Phosphodiester glycosidase